MKNEISRNGQASLAISVAPEDLRCGDYVAVLNVICEFPSFLWYVDSSTVAPHELVRVQFLPREGGIPWKIKAICLPFVFVKPPHGQAQTMDVRKVQFVRLNRDYARRVWKELRKHKTCRRSMGL